MITEKLEKAINYQINRELFSEYYYLSMASYFNAEGLSGFENFFLVQVEEERFHAMKMYRFLNATLKTPCIDQMRPADAWG